MTRFFTTMVCTLAAMCGAGAPAQTFTTLVNFDTTNGGAPENVSLVQGVDGLLYGTTSGGGASRAYGTVFAITPQGALQIVHSFSGTDGEEPYAGLTLGSDGRLYGTTDKGGSLGYGTVFQIGPDQTFTTLHDFNEGQGTGNPQGTVVQAGNGSLYGTTTAGSSGAVFEIAPGGTFLIYYPDWFNGFSSSVGLVQATNGLLYGTDQGGLYESGEVFSLTLNGTYSRVYDFDAATDPDDGGSPDGPLIQASDGNLYGTTSYWGASPSGDGTVFKLTPAGVLTTLHSFHGTDGRNPVGALVEGSDGNFYGTTTGLPPGQGWGIHEKCSGTVFVIAPSGRLTTLHTFGTTDGAEPIGGLVQATDGSFYGTTYEGGSDNWGTVFRLSVGLKPFVKTVPAFASAGTQVLILGNDLTGATSVTFNGVAAEFTVASPTLITATVPPGASTGSIQVVTPGATLRSNVPFAVL